MKADDTIYLGCRIPDEGSDQPVPTVLVLPFGNRLDKQRSAEVLTTCFSFNWGTTGFGTQQLAMAILLDFLEWERDFVAMARHFYSAFGAQIVATWPPDGFTLYAMELKAFLERENARRPFIGSTGSPQPPRGPDGEIFL